MPLTVNGEEITEAIIDAEFERLKPSYKQHMEKAGQPLDEDKLRAWCRENLVERTLLEQHADDIVAEIAANADNQPAGADDEGSEKAEQDPVKRAIDAIVSQVKEPTEEDTRRYYDRHPEHFNTPEQVHASHIVKHAKEEGLSNAEYTELLNAQQELKKGADFKEVAGRVSDCPERGGDLGTFGRGQMVQGFEDVVFEMQPGDVSDIFETEFGHHIAIVHQRHEAGSMTFEVVAPRIKQMLWDHARRTAIEARVDALKAKADIQGLD